MLDLATLLANEIIPTYRFSVGFVYGLGWGNQTSIANLASYYPLWLPKAFTFDTVVTVNAGTAPSGNFDFGIYKASDFSKVVSLGSTAKAGSINTRQEYSITETALPAGAYYMAVVNDSATLGTFQAMNFGGASFPIFPAFGIGWQTSAFPLPSTMAPSHTIANNPLLFRIGMRRSGAGF